MPGSTDFSLSYENRTPQIQQQQQQQVKGAAPEAAESKPQQNSIYNQLDNNPQDGTVNYNEAKNSIFGMMDKSKNAAINLKSGTVTFSSLFQKEAANNKGFSVSYNTTIGKGESRASAQSRVDSQVTQKIQQLAQQINQTVAQQYETKMKELENEIDKNQKTVGEGNDKTTMFKDAAGKTVKSTNADGTSDRFSHNEKGQMLSHTSYDKEGNVTSSVNHQYGANGQLIKSETKDAQGNVTSTTTYEYNGNTVKETTKDNEGNTFTETSTVDSKGRERQYTMNMQGNTSSVQIEQNFDKKGRLDDSKETVLSKQGEGSNTTTTDFRNNGSINHQHSDYTNAEGANIKHDDKHRSDGSMKNEKLTTSNNTQTIKHRMDGDKIKVKNSNGSKELPQGYKAIEGYPNHVLGPDNKVYVMTDIKKNGKFNLRLDYSSKALAYGAQAQNAPENKVNVQQEPQVQLNRAAGPKQEAGKIPAQNANESGGEQVVDGQTITPQKNAGNIPAQVADENDGGQGDDNGVKTKEQEQNTYEVKSGNTLSQIAKDHGISLIDLVAANPQITNPNLIKPGQQLKIPNGAKSQKPSEQQNQVSNNQIQNKPNASVHKQPSYLQELNNKYKDDGGHWYKASGHANGIERFKGMTAESLAMEFMSTGNSSADFNSIQKRLAAMLIKANPSVFNKDGSVKGNADFSKLDIPNRTFVQKEFGI